VTLSLDLFRSKNTNWQIGLINGPNMPNLHNRSAEWYGPRQTIQELEQRVAKLGEALGVTITPFHTNFDGELLQWLHSNAFDGKLHGIIINPAGVNIYGEHVRHCLEDTGLPFIEVHFGNIVARGLNTVFSGTATGDGHGMRRYSYTAALTALVGMLDSDDFVKPKNYKAAKV
jgi:3-dehydroquinate dehydratase-2